MAGSSSIASGTLDTIFSDSNFFTFYAQIEGTPHNNVHSNIGGTFGNYGSASDPLFWNHHCMIDYCWNKWNIDLGTMHQGSCILASVREMPGIKNFTN